MTWIIGAIALGSICWALKERRDAKEWETVCICLGAEYDRLLVELNQPRPQAQPQVNTAKAKQAWLN